MPDEPKKSKKPLAVLAVLVVVGAIVAVWFLKGRGAKTPNKAPIAALRLDSIDETNRVATLSDGGSHDPDGTLRSWRIAWGDGQEENVSSIPRETAHTYASEGKYTISLWCIDNLGATSSPPAMTNLTLDLLQRQKGLELTQEQAKREADRLKEEAGKEAERLQQERQKQLELAALEAQKAKEQQELEAKRKAEAELARQKPTAVVAPPPTPMAAAHPDEPSPRIVIFTPSGYTLGEFQIFKEKTEGTGNDGKLLVTLAIRCANFPKTAIPTSDWHINGQDLNLKAGRIRASLPAGRYDVSAFFTPKTGSPPVELKADVNVRTNGDCVVTPRK